MILKTEITQLKVMNVILNSAIDLQYSSNQTSSLKDLQKLVISTLSIKDINFLQQTCSLKSLSLQSILIQNQYQSIFEALSCLKTLQQLQLKFDLLGYSLEPLLILSNLQSLKISHTSITVDQMKSITQNLIELKTLQIQGRGILRLTQEHITPLKKLKQLESFGLKSLRSFEKQLINGISKTLKSLKVLNLNNLYCQNDEDLLKLQELKLLSFLGLQVVYVKDTTIPLLFTFISQLQGANLSYLKLFESNVNYLFPPQNKLKKLILRQCSLNDQTCSLMFTKVNNLQELDLSFNSINLPTIICLTQIHSNIQSLTLSHCQNLCNKSLILICKKLRKLKTLSISNCPWTEKGMVYLRYLKQLQVLDINNNEISGSTFLKLMNCLPLLVKLKRNRLSMYSRTVNYPRSKLYQNYRQIKKLWLAR